MVYQVDCFVPQGLVIGPLSFVAYTDDVIDVIQEHSVSPDHYAGDAQLRASSKPENAPVVKKQLGSCVADVLRWCASRRLQLNCNKTEPKQPSTSWSRKIAHWLSTTTQQSTRKMSYISSVTPRSCTTSFVLIVNSF